jgi:alkanesulfonate monooxygenase SsuD/methylene tetrahydromethanopterin reductase-like flavin-dependent oxidoreductase (luciferase family)
MEFGMFHEFPSLKGRSDAVAFDEALEQVDTAEECGLDAMWLAELHFAPERSVLSSPIGIAAAMAARTARMKIGLAVQVLPLAHPLRIAEETATVDQLSRGRLIFGVGRSGVVRTYDTYGVPYGESVERFNEALEIIRLAWTKERFSYAGKFYRFGETSVAPRPYQRPHPEIRMAASAGDTFPVIGTMGLPAFGSARHVTWDELKVQIAAYRAAWKKAGHKGAGAVFISAPTFLAASDEEAEEAAEPSIMSFYRYQAALLADSIKRTASPTAARFARADRLAKLTFAQAMKDHVLVGTPDTVSRRLAQLRDELGIDGILAELNCGGLIAHKQVVEALRLLCTEVQPRFR